MEEYKSYWTSRKAGRMGDIKPSFLSVPSTNHQTIMTILSTLVTSLLLATAALTPDVYAHDTSPGAISRRAIHQLAARNSLSKCSSKLRSRDFVSTRLARRAELLESHFQKRSLDTRTAPKPLAPGKRAEPCILTPEVTVGPYYVAAELIRDDISEGQEGIDLLLDFQLVDVNTCEPVPQAMIDVWHANVCPLLPHPADC
jgi:hypothetical protein